MYEDSVEQESVDKAGSGHHGDMVVLKGEDMSGRWLLVVVLVVVREYIS